MVQKSRYISIVFLRKIKFLYRCNSEKQNEYADTALAFFSMQSFGGHYVTDKLEIDNRKIKKRRFLSIHFVL